ncbi:hypothetical protein ACVMB0_000359 [Bradyrhizobium sp. USDA 4451]
MRAISANLYIHFDRGLGLTAQFSAESSVAAAHSIRLGFHTPCAPLPPATRHQRIVRNLTFPRSILKTSNQVRAAGRDERSGVPAVSAAGEYVGHYLPWGQPIGSCARIAPALRRWGIYLDWLIRLVDQRSRRMLIAEPRIGSTRRTLLILGMGIAGPLLERAAASTCLVVQRRRRTLSIFITATLASGIGLCSCKPQCRNSSNAIMVRRLARLGVLPSHQGGLK